MTNPHDQLAEAVAAWRVVLPAAREALIDAAVFAVVEGSESAAVAELAGLESDNGFVIDTLIERVVLETNLERLLETDVGVLATKKLARDVCDGRLGERAVTQWVHARFHHEAEADILNQLAALDDEYDELAYANGDLGDVRKRIRETAALLLRDGVS